MMKIDHILDQKGRGEDSYLVQEPIFGVFDGANSTNRYYASDGTSGGQLAVQIARDVFAQKDKDFKELACKANRKLKEEMLSRKIDFSDKLNLWIAAFAAIKLHKDYFEWLQLGDCQILVIHKDNSFRILVDEYDHDQKALLEWRKLASQRIKNIREMIDKDALKKVRREVNQTWGALTGEEEFTRFLNEGRENLKNIKNVILFTDGLFIPKEDPRTQDDFETFIRLFLKGGLEEVKSYVLKLEDKDPYCWRYPRYKQYDDITAISLSFI